jgi:hypothetical protein
MWNVINIGSMAVSVGVVDFDKLVKSMFGIRGVTLHGEDLVGRRIILFGPLGDIIMAEAASLVVIYCSISSMSVY